MTGQTIESLACTNTDREIWRERADDYYAPSILVTEKGAIGIAVGGHVYVKPVREWHRIARDLRAAEQMLERSGFRRCDIPACNCGSWHHDGAKR